MTKITVTFQTQDRKHETTLNDILPDSKLKDAYEAIPMLLGLPEKQPQQFFLTRTSQILKDNQTFKEANVKNDDKIILFSKDQLPNVIPKLPNTTPETPVNGDLEYPSPSKSNSSKKNTKKLVFSLVIKILILIKDLYSHRIYRKYSIPFSLIVFLIIWFLFNPEFEYTRNTVGMKLGIVKNVQGKNLSGVSLERANLANANMLGTNLNGAQLYQANLSDATLSKASLAGADLRGVNFSRADLTEANLNKANLLGAKLQGTNLRKAKIRDTETGEITTKLDPNAKLAWEIVNEPKTGRDLESKKLDSYNLMSVNLKNAVLSNTSLNWVDLSKANLEGATLYKADLRGTNLNGANLKGVNLTGAHLYKVKTDTSTICPNGKSGPCKF